MTSRAPQKWVKIRLGWVEIHNNGLYRGKNISRQFSSSNSAAWGQEINDVADFGDNRTAAALLSSQLFSLICCSDCFLEFLKAVAQLISGDAQEFSSPGLIAAAALQRLPNQGHFDVIKNDSFRW